MESHRLVCGGTGWRVIGEYVGGQAGESEVSLWGTGWRVRGESGRGQGGESEVSLWGYGLESQR